MLIDWVTIGAQAVNFLILVWLMRRFLYQPVLRAIAAREKRIATELANADRKRVEAQRESDEFRRKNEEFAEQRAALLSRAANEAEAERQRLVAEARDAAAALRSRWQETLRNEEHDLREAISRRTEREVFAITRKVLADLAATTLEERLLAVFIRRLGELDDKSKAGLSAALRTAAGPVLVRSAFDLPTEQRAAIQNALNGAFSSQISIRFETAPELVSGIELIANGQKVAWSIRDYLTAMESGVDQLLKEKSRPQAEAAPAGPELAAKNR